MVKPFTIQAPQKIAEEYGGNKQRIMQAAQMGIVDPTAAVLAGMFIDRMRSAQMQERVPQQTVAQQVMGSPAAAPMPPQSSPPVGGLGATPQAAPPMTPPQGMADGGSAYAAPYSQGGGLSDVPVPDTMFDEPSNGGFGDGYAGGGLVAFGTGGPVSADEIRNALRAQESSGDYGAVNAQGSGALGAYQFMPPTARALAARIGLAYRPDLMSGAGGRSKEGQAYQERLMDAQMKDIMRFSGGDIDKAAAYHFAGPNTAGWGKDTRKYMADIRGRLGADGTTPASPASAGAGTDLTMPSLADQMPNALKNAASQYDSLFPAEAHPMRDKLLAAIQDAAGPEAMKKQEHYDKWMALAQIGFNMASTSSPFLLQAVGQAAAAALPGIKKDKEDRRARSMAALQAYADAEGMDLQAARARRNGILDLAKTNLDMTNKDLERLKDLKVTGMTTDARITAAETSAASRAAAAEAAAQSRIDAAEAKANNTPYMQAYHAARNNIAEQFQRGNPVQDPDTGKWIMPPASRKVSPAYLDALATRIAHKWTRTSGGGGMSPSAIIEQAGTPMPQTSSTPAPGPGSTSGWGQVERVG